MSSGRSFPLQILHEDNHLIAVFKPAGLLSQGDWTGEASAMELVKEYLKTRHSKPGGVYLGLVHRLDRPVAGVLLLARTSKAASRLSQQFRDHTVEKIYWAWLEGSVADDTGRLENWIRPGTPRSEEVFQSTPNALWAAQDYRVIARHGKRTLVEIRLVTGRKHQIRLQWASRGHPVVGDRKYGATQRWAGEGLALLAKRLEIQHPIRPERIVVESPVPPEFAEQPARIWCRRPDLNRHGVAPTGF